MELLDKIEKEDIPYWFPTDRMPEGDESRRNDKIGITHTHHFFTKRNLWVISAILNQLLKIKKRSMSFYLIWAFTSIQNYINKKQSYGGGGGGVTGTLYIPSMISEKDVFDVMLRKIKKLTKLNFTYLNSIPILTNQSSVNLKNIKDNSLDYIFTDPPFGANLMYSELNFIWESWLKVFTNNKTEAIINKSQNKGLNEYYKLMLDSFKECYRILKPNRWITVEFHSSKSSVWNVIQEGIAKAGFIVSQVSILDKKQGSFKQVTSSGAVKNDLVISAFKPKADFEKRFLLNVGEDFESKWVEHYLEHQPCEQTIERTEKLLYSKMLSYYIQRGYVVKYDSKDFYTMLKENFTMEDNFWFTSEQIEPYREWKKKMKLEDIDGIKSGAYEMFISDETSAIVWLNLFLATSKDFSEIHTSYTKLLFPSDSNDVMPELQAILDNNFVKDNDKYMLPKSED